MTASDASALERAITAHRISLAAANPHIRLSGTGTAVTFEDNLLPGVLPAQFNEELDQADGNELQGKFLAPHSSSALAVNTFAPFKGCRAALELAGIGSFTRLQFKRKCPTGMRGGRPPNLDFVAEGTDGVVAV